jgi:lipopolysaccharide export system permease protein
MPKLFINVPISQNMRRFERALTREMAAGAGLAFAALAAIFSVVLAGAHAGQGGDGRSRGRGGDADAWFRLVALACRCLLSLSLFIGVFMSLSRLWRDSEAVIWMNGGVGPWGWARPVSMFVAQWC